MSIEIHSRLVSGPAVEPVTVQEAAEYMRAPGGLEEPVIAALIQAAREKAERFTGRAFIKQRWQAVVFGADAGDEVELPHAQLIEVTQVKVDGEVLPDSQYDVETETEPGTISLIESFDRVEVVYDAGYGTTATTVPHTIKAAILATVAYLYHNRQAVEIPPYVEYMLDPHRIYHL